MQVAELELKAAYKISTSASISLHQARLQTVAFAKMQVAELERKAASAEEQLQRVKH